MEDSDIGMGERAMVWRVRDAKTSGDDMDVYAPFDHRPEVTCRVAKLQGDDIQVYDVKGYPTVYRGGAAWVFGDGIVDVNPGGRAYVQDGTATVDEGAFAYVDRGGWANVLDGGEADGPGDIIWDEDEDYGDRG